MKRAYRNIYRTARDATKYSQEYWAEMIGVSTEAVRQYESGRIMPSDSVALAMAEVACMPILCYWHLQQKSRVAGQILPALRSRPLPEAVLTLLVKVKDFQLHGLDSLVNIAADGKVDESEQEAYSAALQELKSLITAAYELQYAQTPTQEE